MAVLAGIDFFTAVVLTWRGWVTYYDDIKIVNIYCEEGVSGTKESADRPAWSELMTALHANGVRVVIIEKPYRLARDLMVQETIIADLRKHGFELVSVAEPDLMANDPTRKLMRQFMGAISQSEKSQIVLKLRGARKRKRAKEAIAKAANPMDITKARWRHWND